MKNIGIALFSSLIVISFLAFTTSNTKMVSRLLPADNVHWMTMEEAIVANEKEPRKIFIDIYTDWCGWCKRMDAATFQKPHIAAYLNANYYPVKFNAEQKEAITFKGKTYEFVANGRRGYHQLAAEVTRGMLSYPTTVFMDEEMNVIQAIKGYKEAPAFEQIMTYFGGDFHKKMPWEKYQRDYQPLVD